jgi:hypothetical protein
MKISRESFFAILAAFFALILLLALSGHFFRRDRLELARRSECVSNLRQIDERIRDHHITLSVSNSAILQRIIKDLGLTCPSGRKVHGVTNAFYFIVTNEAFGLMVAESEENHNPEHLPRTKVARARFYLMPNGYVTNLTR